VRDPSGKVNGAHGTARDVTEWAAARDATLEAQQVAERAVQTKAAFLANMSHEIRTPMNGVLGMTELLLDTELTADQRRSVELVRISGEALLKIINDILDFSKIDTDYFKLEDVPFDLVGLVDSIVRLLAVRAFDRGIELAYDVHSELTRTVRGDPSRLRQVLTNLIGNAIKFTHEGEVVVSVVAEGGANDEVMVRFTIRDTGIGIPAEKLEAIFEEFNQVDISHTRKYGGTGLGLAISRRLVQLMGGTIQVASEEGKGSVFSFTARLGVEEHTAPPVLRRTREALVGARALVVDDNPSNRRIVSEVLRSADVMVHEVADAQGAVEMLQRGVAANRPYELAIIDAWMPGRDGFDLAQEIRGDAEFAGTKLMMLTSAGQRGDGKRCRELGIQAYLTKPVSRLELTEGVAAVLSGAEELGGDTLITRYLIDETRRRLRILLAEDDLINQQVAASMLRKRGHTVDVVEDGRKAVDAVRSEEFDVVLMDVQMPELDGVAATEEIRRDPRLRDLPIIAMTAHALKEQQDHCLAAGMNGHLAKPFKAEDLFQAVEGLGRQGLVLEESTPINLVEFRRALRESAVSEPGDTVLRGFLQDASDLLGAMVDAVSQADSAGIAAAARAYRAAAANVRAEGLTALLTLVEESGGLAQHERLADLLSRVREEHDSVTHFVEQVLAEGSMAVEQ
jgi:CheY-like chemotaxis protein/nitrogen-specific signal transduction histidine kinase